VDGEIIQAHDQIILFKPVMYSKWWHKCHPQFYKTTGRDGTEVPPHRCYDRLSKHD